MDEALRLHGQVNRRSRAGLLPPALLEWLFTVAALAFLLWQSAAFREPEFARTAAERYRDALELRVPMLAQAAGTGRVAALCARFGGWLPAAERELSAERAGLCHADARHAIAATASTPIEPAALADLGRAHEAVAQSLTAPVKGRLARLDEFANVAREARAEADLQGAIDSLASETRLYREAYGIAPAGARSLPLETAWRQLEDKYAGTAAGLPDEARRAYALLGMAALLDGDAPRAASAAAALRLPAADVASAAGIVARARASDANAGKSQAARELLANAHWIFALWACAGLLLLQFGRQAVRARRFLPAAALLWSVLGWATQVHVEWLSDRAAQTAALLRWGVHFPEFWQCAIAVAAAMLVLGIVLAPGRAAPPPVRQTPSSRLGYAGFVLFVGLGWWLLLDLSVAGHAANRFHALYHQVYVFAAFALLTMLAPLRLQLADRLGRWLGWLLLALRARRTGLKRVLPWLAGAGALALLLAAAGGARKLQPQLTSELFRLWLLLGVSWVFFVRGESALALSAGGGRPLRAGLFLWPLLAVLCVPLAGLVLTDDFGPLFVMLYAASIFVGSVFAFAFFDRAGYRPWLGGAVGVAVAGAWVYLLTFALYSLPAPLARIAERLASVREPFAATNDQMAIITWFQESAPPGGYGLGAVPWCGEVAAGAGCRGVPKQIQSDYVYTALVGVYGKMAAVALVALLAFWLVRVVIHHGRATSGTVTPGSPVATQQAWLSWIAVCWVGLTLAQLAITVAGNIGWLPLTGITFPFASFGAWSLLANTLFLALAINLPRRG